MPITGEHAVVLERNKMVQNRMRRLLAVSGLRVATADDPEQVAALLEPNSILCADAFDAELVLRHLRAQPGLRAWMWTAEPLDRLLKIAVEEPRLSNLFGRPNFESTPRDWELLYAARRVLRPDDPPPFSAMLNWGYVGFKEAVADTEGRERAVKLVQRFIDQMGCPKRVGEMFGELAHELLMNAIYDAPVDRTSGHALFAHDRKANVKLQAADAATLRLASDGVVVAIQVTDPFGRLRRKHVFSGLARGLKGGEMDQSHGGAGLGMLKVYQSTVAMFFDVTDSQRTEVTGVFDLDLNLREFRQLAKSLHYYGPV
jgi:hypothetical protein